MSRAGTALFMILATLGAGREVRAADYWTYTYHDLDVMAEGSQADAVAVARRLSALDEAQRKLLRVGSGAAEPPTRVYALPHS